MIDVIILCVGTLKENYLKEMEQEYSKRLSKYCNLKIIELKDEKLPTNLNEGNIRIIKEKEGNMILDKLEKFSGYTYILDENGKELTSTDFSNKFFNQVANGNSKIVFVIGGSLGLSQKVKEYGNEALSFSKFTFPHQMMRGILLEQLFRIFKIHNNENYHH